MFRNAGLQHQGFLVDSDGQQNARQFLDLAVQLLRFLIDRDGMQVYDAVDAIVVILNPGPVLQGSQVIPDMRTACGLDAG